MMKRKKMDDEQIVITIDGPAGAGKTTVSRILAKRLGYKYIDTGALYRGVAWALKEKGINTEDDRAIEDLCRKLTLTFQLTDKGPRLMCNETDITDRIRTPEITMMASAVSARPVVRQYLLSVQRDMGREKGAVFEGRDMGTVVFPQAEIKFFLDASHDKRADRRYRELSNDPLITLEQVKADMKRRDHNDSNRKLAPLKPSKEAIRIDSSELPIHEVVDTMLSEIEKII